MDFFTVKELAEKLKLTEKYIVTEIQKGNLHAAKFGRRAGYRISYEDFIKWLEAKKNK